MSDGDGAPAQPGPKPREVSRAVADMLTAREWFRYVRAHGRYVEALLKGEDGNVAKALRQLDRIRAKALLRSAGWGTWGV